MRLLPTFAALAAVTAVIGGCSSGTTPVAPTAPQVADPHAPLNNHFAAVSSTLTSLGPPALDDLDGWVNAVLNWEHEGEPEANTFVALQGQDPVTLVVADGDSSCETTIRLEVGAPTALTFCDHVEAAEQFDARAYFAEHGAQPTQVEAFTALVEEAGGVVSGVAKSKKTSYRKLFRGQRRTVKRALRTNHSSLNVKFKKKHLVVSNDSCSAKLRFSGHRGTTPQVADLTCEN